MRVPIRPQVGVFGVFEAVDYKQWYALAEFVDNSIQSALDLWAAYGRTSPLHVSIHTTGGEDSMIIVEDDAGGIPITRFASAFEVGAPPPDATGLSVYGIGMKSAAAWFANRVRITTTAYGEPVQRTVEYDFPSIISNGLQELEVDETPTPAQDHGTRIVLSSLRNPIRTKTHAKVRDHLQGIYRHFLREGLLVLTYGGETLKYEDPEVLVAPLAEALAPSLGGSHEPLRWWKELDFTLSSGEHVRGYAAIRKVGSAAGAGFSLFRRNRVITGIEDDPWRPTQIFGYGNTFRSQRVFGELHLDDMKVTYSKNGFVWHASEEELITRLREELDAGELPLLRQAEAHRAREVTPQQRQAAKKAAKAMGGAFANAVKKDLPERIADPVQDNPPPIPTPDGSTAASDETQSSAYVDERLFTTSTGGKSWEILLRLAERGDRWITVTDMPPATAPAPKRLVVDVNLGSPVMLNFGGKDAVEMESMLRVAAGIALTVTTAREAGVKNSMYILEQLNRLMSGSLGSRR